MSYQLIFAPEGHTYEDGSTSPVYLTVCKKPHWTDEGLMLTSGMYDATKFEWDDPDVHDILEYCRNQFKDKKFCVVSIDHRVFGSKPRELWKEVMGDYHDTYMINNKSIKRKGVDDYD